VSSIFRFEQLINEWSRYNFRKAGLCVNVVVVHNSEDQNCMWWLDYLEYFSLLEPTRAWRLTQENTTLHCRHHFNECDDSRSRFFGSYSFWCQISSVLCVTITKKVILNLRHLLSWYNAKHNELYRFLRQPWTTTTVISSNKMCLLNTSV